MNHDNCSEIESQNCTNVTRPKSKIFKISKLLSTLVPLTVTAEWVQPSYFDALQMAKQRSGDWGFPVGVKAAADWQNCGTPTTAQGFDAGEELECSAATCMLKCPAGQYAIGRRRIRCRWKRKHGKNVHQSRIIV